jgi:hypothetical protein
MELETEATHLHIADIDIGLEVVKMLDFLRAVAIAALLAGPSLPVENPCWIDSTGFQRAICGERAQMEYQRLRRKCLEDESACPAVWQLIEQGARQ